jgi:hypothetical protein
MSNQLTRDYILNLPAGAELDGLVDEHIFHIDRTANTPDVIRQAVRDAWEPPMSEDCVTSYTLRLGGEVHVLAWDSSQHGPFTAGWAWEQREGKPWQAALEAHVAAWRAPPTRLWSTDIEAAWEMEKEIGKRDLTERYSTAMMSLQVGWPRLIDRYDVWHLVHAAPWYRCRAALLAVMLK